MFKPVLYPFLALLLCASVLSAQTAVTTFDPARHESSAPASTDVEATFNTAMATPAASAFRVRSNLRGWLGGSFSVTGSTLAFNPGADLLPGEELEVTLTSGIASAAASPLAAPHVWRFHAEAGTGPIVFNQAAVGLSGSSPWDCKLGDMDNDGDVDVVVGNYVGQNYVFLNDGAGNFPANTPFGTTGSATYAVALADVDNDGDLDIIEGNAAWNQTPANGQSMIHRNDGSGGFSQSYAFGPAGANVMDLDVGDIDGDGDVDFVAGTGYTSAEPNSIFRNDGAGNFTREGFLLFPGFTFEVSDEITWAIRLADTDNDGDLDCICGNFAMGGSALSWIYLNDGAGNYDMQRRVALGGANSVLALAVADWDNDGDVDIAAGGNYGFVSYLFWNNSGNFTTGPALNTGATPIWSLDAGDADGDGDMDLACGIEQGQSWVMRNDGGGTFTGSYTLVAGTSYAIKFGDIDGDGDLDLCSPAQLCLNGAHAPGIAVTSGGSPVQDGGSISVASGATLASLSLGIEITDADSHNVAVYTNISNLSSQGVNVNEFAHTNGAPPYAMYPATGVFNVPGVTHHVTITALDFLDTRVLEFDIVVQGQAPAIEISEGGNPIQPGATGHAFGSQDAASGPSGAVTILVENTGNGTLTIGAINLAGADASEFTLTAGSFPTNVVTGGSVTFQLRFDPSTPGAKSATVQITHDDTTVASPFTFGIQGVGTTPAPVPLIVVREGAASIANAAGASGGRKFGQHTQGSTSPLVIITVENAGNATLTIGNPAASTADFSIDLTGFGNSVAPGQCTSFTVQFNAANVGLHGAMVTFTHNDSSTATPFSFGVVGETVVASAGGNGSGGSGGGGGGCIAASTSQLGLLLLGLLAALAVARKRRQAA